MRTDTVRGNIAGYDVELEFFVESGEQRCFCTVSYRREAPANAIVRHFEYSGSLTLLEAYGYLDCDTSHDGPWSVPSKIVDRIRDWAEEKGY